MRTKPTHIRKWHHLQPKTLRHWVCGSFFLYVAQLSHSYSMWDLDSHFGYLTNLPLKWESLLHWYTPPRAEAFFKYEYLNHKRLSLVPLFYLNGTHFPETSVRKTPLVGKFEGENRGDITIMRTEPNHIREWHYLQPKTLRHWVCWSSFLYVALTFSFLLNVGLKLTLRYLTVVKAI